MKRLVRYVFVGGIGFLVDAGVLSWLVAAELAGPILARCLSFPPAVLATWALNRRLVFTSSARSVGERAHEYGRYFAVQLLGALVNLGVYTLLVAHVATLRLWPVGALAAGSAVALLFNFLGARYWVFLQTPRARS